MEKYQKAIAEKIIRYRQEQQISQSEFAHRCQVPDRYMSDIENAQANPSLRVLCNISSAMGIQAYELLDLNEA